MGNILAEICGKKREHIASQQSVLPLSVLTSRLTSALPVRSFYDALQTKHSQRKTGLIAEIKKASPSRGLIREDFDPAKLAAAYEAAGATCLSVLTDGPYFQGEDGYLALAKQATSLPVLRKDFMLDTYQIYESRVLGADCILLIMAALEGNHAAEMEALAAELGMDVLVEIHSEEELEVAMTHLRSPLIGVNNRNLKTLEVNLETSILMHSMMPDDVLMVCESGIASYEDILRMHKYGVYCFLVGESLMRQKDVKAATLALLGH